MLLLAVTALCVGGLAVVAGAVSFAHMRELAAHHGQLGWKSYAFPISVDGLEIVASLYMVAQRRAGRATGWVPWIALVVGTAASLAANVAVGGTDPVGKALAGWPAVSMLVSIKLLFSMIDHSSGEQPPAVPNDYRPSSAVPDVSKIVLRGRHGSLRPSATGDEEGAPNPESSANASGERLPVGVDKAGTGRTRDFHAVSGLIPAARAAGEMLTAKHQPLSRDNLADAMRSDGYAVSNEKASHLLKILKAERHAPSRELPGLRAARTLGGSDAG